MALRQAATSLVAYHSRTWALGASQGAQGVWASLQDKQDQDSHANMPSPLASSARLFCTMLPACPPSSRQSFLGSSVPRSGLVPWNRISSMQGLQQKRHLNAWCPEQRYFVEGNHVIASEANRVLQYTGLDAGSFHSYFVYGAVASGLATVLVVLPFIVAPSRVDLEKNSAYECGFDAFGEARQTFNVSFYIVSIMYLLFDIEIAYLFPYVMTHANANMFWTMNVFLAILVAGFIYEWGVGALEWRDSEAGH